jgi:hypothetical protein
MSVNVTVESIKQIWNANQSNVTDHFVPENIKSNTNGYVVPKYDIIFGKHI